METMNMNTAAAKTYTVDTGTAKLETLLWDTEAKNTAEAADRTAVARYMYETRELSEGDQIALNYKMLLLAVLRHKPALPNYSRGKRK